MKNLTDHEDELAVGRGNRCKLLQSWGLSDAPSHHLKGEGANDTMGTKPADSYYAAGSRKPKFTLI